MTLKMTTAQVVETSVTVTNSSFQNYTHPDDHTTRNTAIVIAQAIRGKRAYSAIVRTKRAYSAIVRTKRAYSTDVRRKRACLAIIIIIAVFFFFSGLSRRPMHLRPRETPMSCCVFKIISYNQSSGFRRFHCITISRKASRTHPLIKLVFCVFLF